MRALGSTLRGVLALAYLALHTTLWCAPLYIMGGIRSLLPKSEARRAMGGWMDGIINGWVASNRLLIRVLRLSRFDVRFVNDAALSRAGWFLVVSNHQSWVDILVLQDALLGRMPPLKFFTKQELIWAPLVGVAMWLLGFPYVKRYGRERLAASPALRERDRLATLRACEGFKERPTSVLSFLEGTRFTPAKHAAQQSPYRRLLKPKPAGLGYVSQALGGRVAALVDVTIRYPSAPPSFWSFLCGGCERVAVRIEALDAPPATGEGSRDALQAWAQALWQRKDERLAAGGA